MASRGTPVRVQRVCPRILRRLFNDRQFVERAHKGSLIAYEKDSNLAPPGSGQPPGTRTQKVEYFARNGKRLALAIQYRRPDGTLGGSGLPDPKWLLDVDKALIPGHRDDQRCPECGGGEKG